MTSLRNLLYQKTRTLYSYVLSENEITHIQISVKVISVKIWHVGAEKWHVGAEKLEAWNLESWLLGGPLPSIKKFIATLSLNILTSLPFAFFFLTMPYILFYSSFLSSVPLYPSTTLWFVELINFSSNFPFPLTFTVYR